MSRFVDELEELIMRLQVEYDAHCHEDAKYANYIDGKIAGAEEALRIYEDFGD
ncbi:hypothetical protein ACXM2N_03315 [Corynebacterium sp. ZY180755]